MRVVTGVGMLSRSLWVGVRRILANLLRDVVLGPAVAAYRWVAAIAARIPAPVPAGCAHRAAPVVGARDPVFHPLDR
jgi:hypothetical protein